MSAHVNKGLWASDVLEHSFDALWEAPIELPSKRSIVPSSIREVGLKFDKVLRNARFLVHVEVEEGVLSSGTKVLVPKHEEQLVGEQGPAVKDRRGWRSKQEGHPP